VYGYSWQLCVSWASMATTRCVGRAGSRGRDRYGGRRHHARAIRGALRGGCTARRRGVRRPWGTVGRHICYPQRMDRNAQIAHAREHMLPIFERWTDGNVSARRLMECESADPASHEERFRSLIDTTAILRRRGRGLGTMAALDAAAACARAYVGVPTDEFDQACWRARTADVETREGISG
jgi:hypothetical protein